MSVFYEDTVRTWTHKPQFPVKKIDRPNELSLTITAKGKYRKIYAYVEQGTKQRIIVPRRRFFRGQRSVLRFQPNYVPKTTPRDIRAGRGGKFGHHVFRKSVIHPGIKPREFTKKIAKVLEPIVKRAVREAVKRVKARFQP